MQKTDPIAKRKERIIEVLKRHGASTIAFVQYRMREDGKQSVERALREMAKAGELVSFKINDCHFLDGKLVKRPKRVFRLPSKG